MALYRRTTSGPWYADYFDQFGKRKRQSLKTTNKREAERRLRRILNRAEDIKLGVARPEPPKLVTFGEFADKYLRHHASKKQDGGKMDRSRLQNHLRRRFGTRPLAEIHREDVARYQADRMMEKAAPATVNRETQLLKSIYSRAIDWGFAYENPARGVKLLRENNNKERVLSQEEEEALLGGARASRQPKLVPFIILALNTGLRRGELLRLEWRDVDLEHRALVVQRSKSGKSRRVPLNSVAMGAVEELQPEAAGRLFDFGTQVSKTTTKAAERAGLVGVTLHTCRHTFCSRLVARGADLVTVQTLAGHATIVTTMRYAHDVATKEAVALLEPGRNDMSHKRHKVLQFKKTKKKNVS